MIALVGVASAALFEDMTSTWLGVTGEWTNEVRLADVDADGDLDVLLANGGDYASPGTPEVSRLFVNDGTGALTELALPGGPGLARSLAVGDLDGDGLPDILVPGAYQRAARVLAGQAGGGFAVVDRAPGDLQSIGDVELGDVDDDGDLDAVLVDWGGADPFGSGGGPVLLWRNDGGVLTADAGAFPAVAVGMSWDLTLADVDGDFDLDVLVSSKLDGNGRLFLNDGTGGFTDASERLPAASNNYQYEPMDLDGDGDLDLLTINDGNGSRNRVLVNDGSGTFTAGTAEWLGGGANLTEDDNVALALDADGDGDPDVVVGSLSGPDRLLINEGGHFALQAGSAFGGPFTGGTLALAFGDLDGDGRLDAFMGQGEAADREKVYRGTDIAADVLPPVLAGVEPVPTAFPARWHLRAHDRQTPVRAEDLRVELVQAGVRTAFRHLGGDVFAVELPGAGGEVCMTDRAGNEGCFALGDGPPPPPTPTPTDPDPVEEPAGCGCAQGLVPTGILGLLTRR
ncbi:MAG: VCBS repeat-containing protein [Alphaproteobacteria bacterium]|nr:VCBS repeat-containing protein [Alphaproteobacteria bacterium]MCB9672786.1 VCBS repeat-containing protein [Alphaproteobacteria bacterium]MCB9694714.1 VCBS repeat-containing protein [Alphaproteobacteria bacterium]